MNPAEQEREEDNYKNGDSHLFTFRTADNGFFKKYRWRWEGFN
jgi:hypothetical protein